MKTQESKSQLSQFGEFSVAAELNRRGFSATVTYGNMKNADVLAFSEHGHYVVVEVKTSSTKRFLTGLTPEKIADKKKHVFWVLISVKQDQEKAQPRFFVLSDYEIKTAQATVNAKYNEGYKAKHKKDFTGKGVSSLSIEGVIDFEDCWDKIDRHLQTPQDG